jgi:hypothetical protein
MSGSNPDEMDGEGTAFAKRRQLPRRKSQMASRIGCTFTMPVGESVSMIQSQLFSPGRTNVTESGRPYVYKKKNRWPVTVSGEIK